MRVPKLCRHRSSGRAYVTDPATGKPKYLGWWGTLEADAAYRVWIQEYLGRFTNDGSILPPTTTPNIDRLIKAYLAHTEIYYRKAGVPTTEHGTISQALAPLSELFGPLLARDFGPAQLKAVRVAMIARGWARGHINKQVSRIRRMFRWGVEHGLIRPDVLDSLRAVADLTRGRTLAREEEDVPPVPIEIVNATLPLLTPVLADMVRVQLAAGMRPGEVVILTPADVDRSVTPWLYRPSHHKGEHIERDRSVYLGPAARAALGPRLEGLEDGAWVFPTPRVRRGESGRYTTGSYRVAIQRTLARHNAADAGPPGLLPVWFPLQLRHTAGTAIRKAHGIEGAQVVLGHAKADVTEVYAQRDQALAQRIAEEMG